MNRSNELFTKNPSTISLPRSIFPRNQEQKFTLNEGELIPVYVSEVLPGDTISLDCAYLMRSSTPAFPVMDNAEMDISFYFVPNRIIWDHWKQFMGENDTGAWTQTHEYTVPNVIGGYLGSSVDNPLSSYIYGSWVYHGDESARRINLLYARAYAQIYNDWYRWEVTDTPVLFSKGDTDSSDVIVSMLNSKPLTCCKKYDYFTSCLPEPQKGNAVKIPSKGIANEWISPTGGPVDGINASLAFETGDLDVDTSKDSYSFVGVSLDSANEATIRDLTLAFQTQKLLEQFARGGTRYWEMLLSTFGVRSKDSTQQLAEYLGGFTHRLNMSQVVATANGNGASVGNTGAVSVSGGNGSCFTYSASEHGILMGIVTVRTHNTYGDGIDRQFTRLKKLDYYFPALAMIGEQPVYSDELYVDEVSHNEIFGYQEAWADYRFKQNTVNGIFADDAGKAFSYFQHLSGAPVLNSAFIHEPKSKIDQTLLVSSDTSGYQYLCDFYFKANWSRTMPVYSVPGLTDHF